MRLASAFTSPPWSPNKSPNNERAYVPQHSSYQTADEGDSRVDIVPDTLILHGGLYDSFRPIKGNNLTKAHRVILKYRVYLQLTRPIVARRLVAQFSGEKEIQLSEDTGMGVRTELFKEPLVRTKWVLWDAGRDPPLDVGKVHEFQILCELPPKSPRTIKTRSGSVSYEVMVAFEECHKSGHMHKTKVKIPVGNPFSLDTNSPFMPGVEYGMRLEDHSIDMVGSTFAINPKLQMFVEKPDQCVKGGAFEFPVHILFQTTTSETQRVSDIVSAVDVRILQDVHWLHEDKLLATDKFAVTNTVTVNITPEYQANTEWLKCYLPLLDERVHGQFDSKHFIVRHEIEFTVHQARTGLLSSVKSKTKVFKEPVDIFHRDLGVMLAHYDGYVEAPVGADPVELTKRLEALRQTQKGSN